MVKQKLILVISLYALLLACNQSSSDQYEPSVFDKMDGNTAKVFIEIDKKSFYNQDSDFIPNMTIAEKYISINLVDKNGGNLQLQLSRPNWTENKSMPFLISPSMKDGFSNYGTFLIGKRSEVKMEGYMLSSGSFSWLLLNEDQAVLRCQGNLIKPQDADIPSNEIPFSGLIYIKSPEIEFKNLDKDQLFK